MTDNRVMCKYGADCYQKNPKHHRLYKHPDKNKIGASNPTGNGNGKAQNRESGKKRSRDDESSDEGVEHSKKPSLVNKDAISSSDSEDNESHSNDIELSDDEAPSSKSEDPQEFIKDHFLVKMPNDFFEFWKFCTKLNKSNPQDALLRSLGLKLCGPFDVLAGKLDSIKQDKLSSYLRHCRYYYDPPEFQTVIRMENDNTEQYHIGYFRDEPDHAPVFLASNCAAKNCTFTPVGDNIFAAVYLFINELPKKNNKEVVDLKKALSESASKLKFCLDKKSPKMKARDTKAVTKCFHGAGLVVPVDKQTLVGYREISVTDAKLKTLLKSIVDCELESKREDKYSELERLITCVQFANDECDYGQGYELGIDLFCYGDEFFHSNVLQLLPLAYQLLKRPEFAKIIKAHLCDRRKKPYSLV